MDRSRAPTKSDARTPPARSSTRADPRPTRRKAPLSLTGISLSQVHRLAPNRHRFTSPVTSRSRSRTRDHAVSTAGILSIELHRVRPKISLRNLSMSSGVTPGTHRFPKPVSPRRSSSSDRAASSLAATRYPASAKYRAVATWWSFLVSLSMARRGMTRRGFPSSSAVMIVPVPACETTTVESYMTCRKATGSRHRTQRHAAGTYSPRPTCARRSVRPLRRAHSSTARTSRSKGSWCPVVTKITLLARRTRAPPRH